MATDIRLQELLKTRDEILDKLIEDIKSWDVTTESAMEIIEKSNFYIERLKLTEDSLKEYKHVDNDGAYNDKIKLILNGQRNMLENICERRDEVKGIIEQLSKKDIIKDNYIKQNKDSIFVDRDF